MTHGIIPERATKPPSPAPTAMAPDASTSPKRGIIERPVADDLIRAIYDREGWKRHDKGGFRTCAARAQSRYEITADPRRNRYVATPKSAPEVSHVG